MLTPPKGDFAGVPMNREALKIANSWDPASDDAAGQQCRGYGAPIIMRLPGRLHIFWQDDQTLKVEADAGTQSRLFYFGTPRSQEEIGKESPKPPGSLCPLRSLPPMVDGLVLGGWTNKPVH